MKDKLNTKIAMGIIAFALGFGGIYIYKTEFGETAKIEKCADKKWTDAVKKDLGNTPWIDARIFAKNNSAKEKLSKHVAYRGAWQVCERLKKDFPIQFKEQY